MTVLATTGWARGHRPAFPAAACRFPTPLPRECGCATIAVWPT
jgi:hypothetical protein